MNKKALLLSLIIAALFISPLFLLVNADGDKNVADEILYPDQLVSLEVAINWLVSNNQNPDGGYGIDFGTGVPASNVSSTLDAILAIASGGYNPASNYFRQEMSPIDFLNNQVNEMKAFANGSGGANGKVILALVAANQDPRSFGGEDWVTMLTAQSLPSGAYNTADAFNQSLAILALTSVNEPIPDKASDWLKGKQANNGSWNDGFGTMKNSDSTAMSTMALLAAGTPTGDLSISKAVQFLRENQLPAGGWEYGSGFGENANSTALVVQALSAVGEDFYSHDSPWAKNNRSPMEVLLSWQGSSGAFQADFGQGPSDNFFATSQSILAVTGKPLPLLGKAEAARRAISCLSGLQDRDSGGWEQFAGFGINAAGTSRTIEAIAASGGNPQSDLWTPGGTNAVQALADLTPNYLLSGQGGRVGTIMQGVVVAGEPHAVSNFAGFDLPLQVSSYLSPTGEYDDTRFGVVAHSEAMLGLIIAESEVDPTAVDLLLNNHENGDWGDPDGNGIALNVLGRLGVRVPAAINNLRMTQADDAGWGFGLPSDPSSTSEAVQGLIQNGENPFSPGWSKIIQGKIVNPADTIMDLQESNGCWPNRWGPGDDPFGTTDAIMLLVQEPEWRMHQVLLPVTTQ
jgi:hypothetical protein